jgi:hypothetical protein
MIHFIDDIREPSFLNIPASFRFTNIPLWDFENMGLLHGAIVSRSSEEAKRVFLLHGIHDILSFDHDLGEGDDAIDLVNWLIEEDYDRDWINPKRFKYIVHSMNPVGAQNIHFKLSDYLKYKRSLNDR